VSVEYVWAERVCPDCMCHKLFSSCKCAICMRARGGRGVCMCWERCDVPWAFPQELVFWDCRCAGVCVGGKGVCASAEKKKKGTAWQSLPRRGEVVYPGNWDSRPRKKHGGTKPSEFS
jgi:hypothetical protein